MTNRLLRCKWVCHDLGLSRTTLWRMVRDGRFPAPVKITGYAIAWRADEVAAWIDARPAAGKGAGKGAGGDAS
jgi:prophage regulatory protein